MTQMIPLDATGYEPDEYDYIVMDANESDEMAMRCAFITDEYTHPDVADYTEEVTDADGDKYTWTHVYEGTTGMLAHIYVGDSHYTIMKQKHGEIRYYVSIIIQEQIL